METLVEAFPQIGLSAPHSTTIRTTLYDLIDAIANAVGPDEEAFVTATAIHLLDSHRARFIGKRLTDQTCCERANYLRSASA
jgi:hypothetical protein